MATPIRSLLAAFLTSGSVTAAAATRIDEHGLTMSAGPVELNLGGRMQLDGAMFDRSDHSRGSAAKVRRARVELSGRVGQRFRFRLDREFAGASRGWRNVWAEVDPFRHMGVRAGNFVAPFSEERLESSNSIAFMERSIAASLSPGYGLGGAVFANGRHWTLGAGWFTKPLGKESASTERGRGVVARGTIVPWKSGRRFLQLGVAAERRSFDGEDRIRFSADPGTVLAPPAISTRSFGSLHSLFALDGQAAVSLGSVLLQGEEFKVHLDRRSETNSLNGLMLQARWLLGGEHYGYSGDTAVFTGPELKRGKSAFELAARYSGLDLRSGRIQAGVANEFSAGANWYLNRNVRTMLDYTYVKNDRPPGKADVTNHVIAARVQLAF